MMRLTAGLLFWFLLITPDAKAATIVIDGKTVGPGSPRMVVDGISAGQAEQANNRVAPPKAATPESGTSRIVPTVQPVDQGKPVGIANPRDAYGGIRHKKPSALGLIRKINKYGECYYYVNEQGIDANLFTLLTRRKSAMQFDLGKIGEPGRPETMAMFEIIWQAFRRDHGLDQAGRFMTMPGAETADHLMAKREFAHHVSEKKVNVTLNCLESCPACGVPTPQTNTQTRKSCPECTTTGCLVVEYDFELSFTGKLPERPSLKELESNHLLGGVTMETKKPEVPPADLTQDDIFKAMKMRAEGGESQSQYEIALLYAPFNPAEAAAWLHAAAMRNHRMAQLQLSILYETGRGVPLNLYDAMRWRRTSALLGCRQSQLQMGKIYLDRSNGDLRYAELIAKSKDTSKEAYAWLSLASCALPPRKNPKSPAPEELVRNEPILSVKDYESEKNAAASSVREIELLRESMPPGGDWLEAASRKASELTNKSLDYRDKNPSK